MLEEIISFFQIFLKPEILFFLIFAVTGLIFLLIIVFTEMDLDLDDTLLVPVFCGLVNFGLIGMATVLVSSDMVLAAVFGGIFSGITILIVFYIKRNIETEPTDYETFEGQEATIDIPFTSKEIGRIIAIHPKSGLRAEFAAKAFNPNESPFERGDRVIIKKVNGMMAEITKDVNWELKKLKLKQGGI